MSIEEEECCHRIPYTICVVASCLRSYVSYMTFSSCSQASGTSGTMPAQMELNSSFLFVPCILQSFLKYLLLEAYVTG